MHVLRSLAPVFALVAAGAQAASSWGFSDATLSLASKTQGDFKEACVATLRPGPRCGFDEASFSPHCVRMLTMIPIQAQCEGSARQEDHARPQRYHQGRLHGAGERQSEAPAPGVPRPPGDQVRPRGAFSPHYQGQRKSRRGNCTLPRPVQDLVPIAQCFLMPPLSTEQGYRLHCLVALPKQPRIVAD